MDLRDSSPVVSVYHLRQQDIIGNCNAKIVTEYNNEWLEFATSNRIGKDIWNGYDYVDGGVANDRIINTV